MMPKAGGTEKLVCLRNPHGNEGEWKGPWGDNTSTWVRVSFSPGSGPACKKAASRPVAADDGALAGAIVGMSRGCDPFSSPD